MDLYDKKTNYTKHKTGNQLRNTSNRKHLANKKEKTAGTDTEIPHVNNTIQGRSGGPHAGGGRARNPMTDHAKPENTKGTPGTGIQGKTENKNERKTDNENV